MANAREPMLEARIRAIETYLHATHRFFQSLGVPNVPPPPGDPPPPGVSQCPHCARVIPAGMARRHFTTEHPGQPIPDGFA